MIEMDTEISFACTCVAKITKTTKLLIFAMSR